MPHLGHGNGNGHADDGDEEPTETSALLCADIDFSKVSGPRLSAGSPAQTWKRDWLCGPRERGKVLLDPVAATAAARCAGCEEGGAADHRHEQRKHADSQVPVYPLVHEIRIDIVAHIGELELIPCIPADRRHAVDLRPANRARLDVHDHPPSDGQVHCAAEPQRW